MSELTPEERNQILIKKYGEKFCAAPFTSLHEGEGGLISTCCKTRNPLGFTANNTLEEIINSNESKQVRKQFLEKKAPAQCNACWEKEENGSISLNRLFSNSVSFDQIDNIIKNTELDGTLKKQSPVWLDLLWTNKCNFACLGCKPEISSTIANQYINEYSILHNIDYTNSVTNWNNHNDKKIEYILKHKDSIDLIHLNGGEPFMSEDIYDFLDILIKNNLHKKITIWSHTNGSVKKYKGKDIILDYLSKWEDKCRITMSIDGHGKIGEYIRYGYNDKKWLETYNKIDSSKIQLSLQSCLNIFNIFYIGEFADWISDNNLTQNSKLTMWYDSTINIRMLNHIPELKSKAIEYLKQTLEKNNLPPNWKKEIPNYIKWLEVSDYANESKLISFYQGMSALDKKRNTSILETFPVLEPLYFLGKKYSEL